MSEVTRYKYVRYDTGDGYIREGIEPHANGEWVKFDDVVLLQQHLAEVEQDVRDRESEIFRLRDLEGVPRCWKLEHIDYDSLKRKLAEATQDKEQAIYALQQSESKFAAVEQERVNALEATYIPGSWACTQCEFGLVTSNLYVLSGTIGPNTDEVPLCPNDGSLMRRCTWKERVKDDDKYITDRLDEIDALKAQLQARDTTVRELRGYRDRLKDPHGPDAQAVIERWLITFAQGEAKPGDCQGILQRFIEEAARGAEESQRATITRLEGALKEFTVEKVNGHLVDDLLSGAKDCLMLNGGHQNIYAINVLIEARKSAQSALNPRLLSLGEKGE